MIILLKSELYFEYSSTRGLVILNIFLYVVDRLLINELFQVSWWNSNLHFVQNGQ